VTSGL